MKENYETIRSVIGSCSDERCAIINDVLNVEGKSKDLAYQKILNALKFAIAREDTSMASAILGIDCNEASKYVDLLSCSVIYNKHFGLFGLVDGSKNILPIFKNRMNELVEQEKAEKQRKARVDTDKYKRFLKTLNVDGSIVPFIRDFKVETLDDMRRLIQMLIFKAFIDERYEFRFPVLQAVFGTTVATNALLLHGLCIDDVVLGYDNGFRVEIRGIDINKEV